MTDPSGAVVPNVEVEIRDSAKGTTQATKSDREGAYRFYFLLPGRYTLSVTHEDFREQRCEVEVPLGLPVTRNITLEVAGGSTTVKVTDEMPLLQTENGDASTTVSQTQISEVPNPGNDLLPAWNPQTAATLRFKVLR